MRLFSKAAVVMAVCTAVGFMSSNAEALTIAPGGGGGVTEVCTAEGGGAGPNNEAAFLAGCGVSADFLYKANVGGAEEGPLAGSYETVFIPANDPSGATITYVGGPAASCPTCYALVKDGNQNPGWYLFDLGNWDGMETLTFTGFWPDNGAISHISLYGDSDGGGGGGIVVPEPASLSLFGLGLLGAAYRARRRRVVA